MRLDVSATQAPLRDLQGHQWLARIALVLAAVPLVQGLLAYLLHAAQAISFRYEIDYGEGIVWQQLRSIMATGGYGSIDGWPAIVFHYPPGFHALSAALAGAGGLDQLAAGRMLSVTAMAIVALCSAAMVRMTARADADALAKWICAVLTGLIVFSLYPVMVWSMLMRVDTVALGFSFMGVYFGIRSLTAPKAVHLAALCFVIAVYTKQTSIAAPSAVFGILLFLRPRTALAGIATAVVAGLAALAALTWLTGGGFIRHILFYNINRFDASRLMWVADVAIQHALYLVVAAMGVSYRLALILTRDPGQPGSVKQRLVAAPADAGYMMIVAYALATTLILVTVAKSGSNINYFLEWVCVIALLTGLALCEAAAAATGVSRNSVSVVLTFPLAILVAVQAFLLPNTPGWAGLMNTARVEELEQLGEMVRTSQKPVSSDDMVMLLRNGHDVQWESAIFAELSQTGIWDERRIIDKIKAGTFGFFITTGVRGQAIFDARYNPAVADAIDAHYPEKRMLAGYTLHFPRSQ